MDYKNQAIGESIFWWLRDEFWLHNSLQNIENSLDKGTSELFTEKVIGVFLNRYSVRRTIQKGKKSEQLFTSEIVNTNFLNTVKKGEIDQLEYYSKIFKSSSEPSLKSALSKFAALYNPKEFVMYDSRSRKGMHRLRKPILKVLNETITYSKIENYSNYVTYAKILSNTYDNQHLKDILNSLSNSEIKNFLLENLDAFKLRIVVKWLWLEGYSGMKPVKIDPLDYIEILNYES